MAQHNKSTSVAAAPAAASAAAVQRTRLQKLQRFVRLNALFLAIGTGCSLYFLFHYVTFLAPIKYPLKHTAEACIPVLIFTMLFISFSKVEVRKMKPRRWHLIAVIWQLLVPFAIAYGMSRHPEWGYRVELEGIIACIITPTAAAASVITGKLGGDESSITTYTILSNMGAAICVPLIFPLISPVQVDFWEEFYHIFMMVFPMIGLPLIAAQIVRFTLKPINRFVVTKLKDIGYYLWATTLISVAAMACSNMMNAKEESSTVLMLALIGLLTTALNFALGKGIGHLEGQRISGGQGMGQKNMAVGIWMTAAYLSPAASIAPGCYILWQNIMNSWQIWYRDTRNLTYTDKF